MSNDVSTTFIAFSTKVNGSMKKPDGKIDFDNLGKFLSAKKLSSEFVSMEQIHAGNVSVVSDNKQNFVRGVDGLVTDQTRINLCIVTADCLPILLHDKKQNTIGAAHAGSKGLLRGVINNTVTELINKYGSQPEDILVVIGPAIEKNCYEVGEEIIANFEEQFEWFDSSFFSRSETNRYLLDLRKIALHCLMKEGILKEHIEISEQCTKCSAESLYSYRRGDKTERFVSVISLV